MKSRKRSNKVQPFLCSLRWLPIRSINVVQDFDPVLQCFHRLHLIQLLIVHTTFRHRHSSPLLLRHMYILHACIYIYICIPFTKMKSFGQGSFTLLGPTRRNSLPIRDAPLWFFFNFQRCSQFKTDMFKSACFWSLSPCMLQFTNKTSKWGTADAETEVPFSENPKVFNSFPFLKPGVCQTTAKHAWSIGRTWTLPIYAFPVQSTLPVLLWITNVVNGESDFH